MYEAPGLVPRWARAQTWGHTILVRAGGDAALFVEHELTHVAQYERAGWFGVGFWIRYLYHYLRLLVMTGEAARAYAEHPLEREVSAAPARRTARDDRGMAREGA